MSLSSFSFSVAAFCLGVVAATAVHAADQPVGGSCQLFKESNHTGPQLSVARNQSRTELEQGWDDEISSLKVAPGCLLVGFKEKGFRGANQTFGPGEYASMPEGWDNHISSVQCNCR